MKTPQTAGWRFRASRLRRGMWGQGLVETLLALPILVAFIGGLIQLLWLLLAQQMLQATTLYMAREVSHDDFQPAALQLTFLEHMQPLPGRSWALPNIRLVAPSIAMARNYGRYDEDTGNYQLDAAFLRHRLEQQNRSPEEWESILSRLVVTIEVHWCFPLRVPVVNHMLQTMLYPNIYQRPRWCLASGYSGPEILLRSRATLPLRSRVTVPDSG